MVEAEARARTPSTAPTGRRGGPPRPRPARTGRRAARSPRDRARAAGRPARPAPPAGRGGRCAPGSTSAPRTPVDVSGSAWSAVTGTASCSASAPGQPFRIPTSNRSAQTCCAPLRQRRQWPQPSIVSPMTRRPIQLGSTPSPDRGDGRRTTRVRSASGSGPGRRGGRPSRRRRTRASVPQIPARSTSTTTWPDAATGGSTSWTEASPGPVMTNARIGSMVAESGAA